ncbi:hypothetical protein ACKWLM_005136, partial [Escherichia coli]
AVDPHCHSGQRLLKPGTRINIWALNFQDVPSGTIKADPTLYYIFITQCDMIILGELHHGFFWLKATM